jgi:hypothetical protein
MKVRQNEQILQAKYARTLREKKMISDISSLDEVVPKNSVLSLHIRSSKTYHFRTSADEQFTK